VQWGVLKVKNFSCISRNSEELNVDPEGLVLVNTCRTRLITLRVICMGVLVTELRTLN